MVGRLTAVRFPGASVYFDVIPVPQIANALTYARRRHTHLGTEDPATRERPAILVGECTERHQDPKMCHGRHATVGYDASGENAESAHDEILATASTAAGVSR
jgi:hypothetical protein